jgi:hypothetical protein
MKSEFLKLAQLRSEWRRLHQTGDQQGVKKVTDQAALHSSFVHPNPDFQKKLNDFSREWEIKIAEIAYREDAIFFSLPLSMRIEETTSIHHSIEMQLTSPAPWGVLLFCEAAPQLSKYASKASSIENGQWCGIYYFTILSHRKPTDLQLESLPGVTNVGPITIL